MFQPYRIVLWTAALALTGILSGCGPQVPEKQQKATVPPKKAVPEQTGAALPEGPENVKATLAGLAELSAEDRAAAEKQRVCPVTGDVLGAHGRPIQVTVKGQTVFLCCRACEKEVLADPDKYLAKLQADQPK